MSISQCRQYSLALGLLGRNHGVVEGSDHIQAHIVCTIMAPVNLNEIFNMSNTVHHHNSRGSGINLFLPRANILKKCLLWRTKNMEFIDWTS